MCVCMHVCVYVSVSVVGGGEERDIDCWLVIIKFKGGAVKCKSL